MINFRNNNEENKEKEKKDLKQESLRVNIFKDKAKEEKVNSFVDKLKNKKPKFNFEKKEKGENFQNNLREIFLMIDEFYKKIKKSFVEGENLSIKIMVGLWCVTIISGILYFNSSANDMPKVVFERKATIKESEKEKIYIFYPEGETLISSEIEVNKMGNKNILLRKTLDETINKLKTLDRIPNINEKVEVFCYLVDNVIYLDLPEKLFDKVKSPKEELLLIYSFVNTMTNVDTNIKSVKILINGGDMDKVKYANLKKDFKFRKNI